MTCEEEGFGDAEPIEANPTNEENAHKALKEEPEKTKSSSINTSREDEEEANPLVTPPMDSNAVVPLPSMN
ncbi:hypothetical protein PVK06_005153 [Gossypium arboreum]|uniref:Uncharacterized protein n=1 Tax=Gossypium arboreum TaxID=29729 RepID=A0ABR0QV69_GOSAR|nr:hypothetical protein PVK06_005153 [Gossypium arboreum]